jgi:lipopolysaccharide exporter
MGRHGEDGRTPGNRLDAAPPSDDGRDATAAPLDLRRSVRRGLAWGFLNSVTLRLGTFTTSIVLARLLSPEDFGAYAVALTLQTVLINLADLGLTSYLVRRGGIGRRGPSVTALAALTGSLTTALMWVSAPAVSEYMGAPEATPVVRLMSVVVLVAALGVVPSARIQRNFLQGRQFAVDGSNFVVSTGVTIVLALLGLGPWALGIGRVAAQVTSTSVSFWLARERLRFGWDKKVMGPALRFGLPLALANVLSWVLLTVDNAMVGHQLGVVSLGLYVLAFNVSSWPMSVVGATLRAVALPGFARVDEDLGAGDTTRPARGPALAQATMFTAVVALPLGAVLAVLAHPLVETVYGAQWGPAAGALAGLGVFGASRIVMDLFVSYLVASGATRSVLAIQALWLVCLTPAIFFAIRAGGLPGAGWAHLVVAALVTFPAYLVALKREGVDSVPLCRSLLPGAFLAGVVALACQVVSGAVDGAAASLGVGMAVSVLTWAAFVVPWAAVRARRARQVSASAGAHVRTGEGL